MKKAKILVPAIAALVLSSAAAVTGTVAWFTSTLTADFTNSHVTIVETGGSLNVKSVTNNFGTKIDKQAVTHGTFVDGSVDLSKDKVYGPTYTAVTGAHEGFEEVTYDPQSYSGTVQYRATKFTIQFEMDLIALNAGETYGLFLDMAKTTNTTQPAENDMRRGLRVGFKTTDGIKVLAPYNDGATLTYVTSNDTGGTAASGSYTGTTVVATKGSTTANYDTTVDTYIGGFGEKVGEAGHSDKHTLDVAVYTWFEGSDASIKNGNVAAAGVTLDLSFNAIPSTQTGK